MLHVLMQPVTKGYWVEMVRCSEHISSSGDNDSSGGGRGRKTKSQSDSSFGETESCNFEKILPI